MVSAGQLSPLARLAARYVSSGLSFAILNLPDGYTSHASIESAASSQSREHRREIGAAAVTSPETGA
jgi:hypothetical protein